MGDPYIGEIRAFPYTFAPYGWLECNGALCRIAEYAALAAVIGNQYGGDGTTTFAIPDLRGRAPVGTGQGPGLSPYTTGEQAGTPSVALNITELPPHNHSMKAAVDPTGFTDAPGGAYVTRAYVEAGTKYDPFASYSAQPTGTLASSAVASAGNSAAHDNQQPCLAFRYCIATTGIYPTPD